MCRTIDSLVINCNLAFSKLLLSGRQVGVRYWRAGYGLGPRACLHSPWPTVLRTLLPLLCLRSASVLDLFFRSSPLFAFEFEQWLPWHFSSNTTHFWIQYGLVIAGFVLAIATFLGQCRKPAPYGRHQNDTSGWGPLVPQRIAHTLSDTSALLSFILVNTLVYCIVKN
jgi:hypothetical protein